MFLSDIYDHIISDSFLTTTRSTLLLSIALILIFRFILRPTQPLHRTLPPGPPKWPIIGNAIQMSRKHLASYLSEQVHIYGGLMSFKVFTTDFIVIGDMDIAKELLQKRSARYSSRPITTYYKKYIDPKSVNWAFTPQIENNLIGRRVTRGLMDRVRAGNWDTLHEVETLHTLRRLLAGGERTWYREMQRVSCSTVFAATFGKHCPVGDEEDVKAFHELVNIFFRIYHPSSLINTFPILDYIPGPMPWRKLALEFRDKQVALYKRLVDEALERQALGRSSWAAAFVHNEKYGDCRHLISQVFEAAMETTATTLHIFFLACAMHPEWISRAQLEIDKVVGADRVPIFSDRSKLPYIDAIVREVIRWHPVLRSGIPHVSTADDVVQYQGKEYFIPEGSIVLPLAWHIERDSTRYHEPDNFLPERFLDAFGNLRKDYETSSFGFGRRKCPGTSFAERTLWINIVNILWMFDIQRSEETDPKTGRVFPYTDSDDAFRDAVVNGPFEFPVVLTPRSIERTETVKKKWDVVKDDFVVV